MTTLDQQLSQLDPSILKLLERHHFDPARFGRLAARVRSGEPARNRVTGTVTPPAPGDVTPLPEAGSPEYEKLEQAGLELLRQGQCALVVLAGGMATRMGGVVKALVEALPGKTFLDLRLLEMDEMQRRVGRRAPLWLMTSYATEEKTRAALGDRLDGQHIATFSQHLSIRLTPAGDVFLDDAGRPSEHAPGHGDLPDALQESGLLQRFVEQGGRMVAMANLDNLGATLDPAILGWHASHGQPVTCEVVDKVGSDRGGIPVRLDDRPVVLEEFRLPEGFDPTTVRVFNTNTFVLDAATLLALDMDFTWFTVTKQVDGKPAVQFERLVGEVTSALDTKFLRVPREGASSRFLPVKDQEELEARRPQIEAVCRSRGVLR
jgi:UTP--glucose-1-phosphate uridylyltransferase